MPAPRSFAWGSISMFNAQLKTLNRGLNKMLFRNKKLSHSHFFNL
jgi:hypothetical protein